MKLTKEEAELNLARLRDIRGHLGPTRLDYSFREIGKFLKLVAETLPTEASLLGKKRRHKKYKEAT